MRNCQDRLSNWAVWQSNKIKMDPTPVRDPIRLCDLPRVTCGGEPRRACEFHRPQAPLVELRFRGAAPDPAPPLAPLPASPIPLGGGEEVLEVGVGGGQRGLEAIQETVAVAVVTSPSAQGGGCHHSSRGDALSNAASRIAE